MHGNLNMSVKAKTTVQSKSSRNCTINVQKCEEYNDNNEHKVKKHSVNHDSPLRGVFDAGGRTLLADPAFPVCEVCSHSILYKHLCLSQPAALGARSRVSRVEAFHCCRGPDVLL